MPCSAAVTLGATHIDLIPAAYSSKKTEEDAVCCSACPLCLVWTGMDGNDMKNELSSKRNLFWLNRSRLIDSSVQPAQHQVRKQQPWEM
ncbi:hypothetical protein AAFF_G00230990 [Aldrovandia affinis]|uniref:Uncharacterized protein n=1 Tax=Aldrovandia affinis TaxID=143900 RepID=A0AAD7RHX5_9TELE|nr:hypothetical protein AAFF_G00230990 [Aldrovandia affinis]